VRLKRKYLNFNYIYEEVIRMILINKKKVIKKSANCAMRSCGDHRIEPE